MQNLTKDEEDEREIEDIHQHRSIKCNAIFSILDSNAKIT